MTGVIGNAQHAAPASGAALAACLESVDVSTLDDHELIDAVADWERLMSWAASCQLGALAEFARRPARIERVDDDAAAVRAAYGRRGEWVREFADDELAARTRLSRITAARRMSLACALERLPVTSAALREGRYDVARAQVVADEVSVLDVAPALEVEAAVVERGAQEPPARLRARLRRAVLSVDPVAAQRRARRARCERRVGVFPREDGMAGFYAVLPAADAMTIDSALNAAARAMHADRSPGDDTKTEQLRADALVAPFARALETGALDGTISVPLARRRGERTALQVTVEASTLLGADDEPAILAGYGPITADVARELARDARWRRVLTDPASGAVLDVGTTTYRPPADLQRHVEARDTTCRFPACGWPARAGDIDHVVPFPDGATSAANLVALCRRHHRMKHSGAVRLVRDDGDGSVHWTLPTGHAYRVEPTPLAAPSDDSGPAP